MVHTAHESFACADISQRVIEAAIKEQGLNRVVIAACTPRTHEPVFREVLARCGLNPYLIEMVNKLAGDGIGEPEKKLEAGVVRVLRRQILGPLNDLCVWPARPHQEPEKEQIALETPWLSVQE